MRRGFASWVESVEYFYATESDARTAKALGLGAGELDAAGERRAYVQYLSGGDNDAGPGELVAFERPIPADAQTVVSVSPLSGLITGQRATGGLMRDLAAGKTPRPTRPRLRAVNTKASRIVRVLLTRRSARRRPQA